MKVCSVCKCCFNDAVLSCNNDAHPPLTNTRTGDRGVIPGYTIETLLEANARRETYRARHNGSGQTCMVRLVSAEPDAGRRFLEEAKLAAAMFHANLADVYESGELEGGTFYVVAEDLNTQTLRDVLNTSGPPALLDSIHIIRQTAEAVHALHLKGLTHRALRPENIRLNADEEEQVRIVGIDFGGLDEQGIVSNKFLIDTAIDSLRYFAPEQCTGEGSGAGSDVYGLGAVLYEMLAGVPPFDAAKATALIDMHLNQRPPELKIENFDLRMLVTYAITESLQKKASFRQCSADLFARQMRHIEQLATHVSTPPPAVTVPGTPRINFAAWRVQSAPPAFRVHENAEAAAPMKVRHSEPEPIAIEEPIFLEEEPVALSQPEAEQNFEVEPVVEEIEAATYLLEDVAVREQVDEDPERMPIVEPVPKIEEIIETRTEPTFRRSRLKLKKKQLHTLTAAVQSTSSAAILPPPDPPRIEIPSPVIYEPKAVAQPAIAEAATFTPRLVKFDVPEDDIPTMDDVLADLAGEPIPEWRAAETQRVEEVIHEAAAAAPVRPAPETIIEPAPIPVAKPAVELPVQAVKVWAEDTEEITAEPVETVRPKSVSRVADLLNTLPIVEQPGAERVAAAAISAFQCPPPKRVEIELPEDDVPSIDEVLEVLANEPLTPTRIAAAPPTAIEKLMKTEPVVAEKKPAERKTAPFETAFPEFEEITVERSPRRINVEWDKPAAQKYPQRVINQVEFVPTLLGGRSPARAAEGPADDSIFGTYRVNSPGFAIPYRVMAAGSVGLAAVVTLSLFGGYLTGSLAESVGGRNDTVATTVQPHAATTQKVQASDSQQPQPQALQQQPEPIKPVKAFQEPVRETTLAEPVPPKKESVKMRTQVEAVEPKPASQKNVAKPPLVPTTRVISTENGATKSKVVTAEKAPEKKTAPMKSAGTTRPRIVQIPK